MPMLIQGHFHAGMQFGLVKRLHDIAQGPRLFGALQSIAVRMRGQIDHRNVEAFPQNARSFRSVHLALDADVHQHQIGRILFRLANGFVAARNHRADLVSQILQNLCQVFGGDAFIFYD